MSRKETSFKVKIVKNMDKEKFNELIVDAVADFLIEVLPEEVIIKLLEGDE